MIIIFLLYKQNRHCSLSLLWPCCCCQVVVLVVLLLLHTNVVFFFSLLFIHVLLYYFLNIVMMDSFCDKNWNKKQTPVVTYSCGYRLSIAIISTSVPLLVAFNYSLVWVVYSVPYGIWYIVLYGIWYAFFIVWSSVNPPTDSTAPPYYKAEIIFYYLLSPWFIIIDLILILYGNVD